LYGRSGRPFSVDEAQKKPGAHQPPHSLQFPGPLNRTSVLLTGYMRGARAGGGRWRRCVVPNGLETGGVCSATPTLSSRPPSREESHRPLIVELFPERHPVLRPVAAGGPLVRVALPGPVGSRGGKQKRDQKQGGRGATTVVAEQVADHAFPPPPSLNTPLTWTCLWSRRPL
jgi:hypothetical protein